MGASVGLMMKILNPEWKIKMVERLDRVAGESCAQESEPNEHPRRHVCENH